MDVKRIFLYAAVVVLGFLIWNTWQIEQAPKLSEEQPTQSISSMTQNNSVPTQTTTNIPVLTTQTISRTEKPIHVKTDVLDVMIDPVGGRIIQANLLQYPESEKQKTMPVTLLNENPNTLYTAQSDVLKNNAIIPLNYTSPKAEYVLQEGENQLVVTLTAMEKDLRVTKTFTFSKGSYEIPVSMRLKNGSQSMWEGYVLNSIQRKEVPKTSLGVLQYSTFQGAAISTPLDHYKKYSFSDMLASNVSTEGAGGWVAMMQHYFITAWVPNAAETNRYYTHNDGNNVITVGVVGPQMTLAPKQSMEVSSVLYVGPIIAANLEHIAPYLSLTVDYGWLWFISAALFWVMQHINNVLNNWGWSIVAVTILIKLVFYRLSASSYRSMARMRQLQPKIEALKERHAGDRQKLGLATMELYRKEKVNPLGGCLPIIVQIPVFLALYYVLIESVELRQAPFMLWIQNLAMPDPYFVLPILMGLSMLLQQKLSPAPPDPTQAKVMMIMPIVFTVFFLYFPAGLVLYWLVNNIISLLQQWYITYRVQSGKDIVKRK